jgi:hypothetical protein
MKKFFAFLAVCLMVSPVMAVSAPRGRALGLDRWHLLDVQLFQQIKFLQWLL